MRRSRTRRSSRDVQVIIRDGGKSSRTPTRSSKPRYGSKPRGPRRSWRGPWSKGRGPGSWAGKGAKGGLTRKSVGRDPSPTDLKHLSARALVKLLKQAVRSGNEYLAEAIGKELDKRAARLGY